MSISSFSFRLLLLFVVSCCYSFSAVPASVPPIAHTPIIKNKKRQVRQEKQQQRRLNRLHARQKRQQHPPKNHAQLNLIGFFTIIGAIGLFILGVLALLLVLGFSAAANLPLYILFAVCCTVFAVGGVFSLLGVIGSKDVPNSKRGFGIAGLILVSIPLLIGLVVLFVALGRALSILA